MPELSGQLALSVFLPVDLFVLLRGLDTFVGAFDPGNFGLAIFVLIAPTTSVEALTNFSRPIVAAIPAAMMPTVAATPTARSFAVTGLFLSAFIADLAMTAAGGAPASVLAAFPGADLVSFRAGGVAVEAPGTAGFPAADLAVVSALDFVAAGAVADFPVTGLGTRAVPAAAPETDGREAGSALAVLVERGVSLAIAISIVLALPLPGADAVP